MARVDVQCPDCGFQFTNRSDEEGRKITCPECEARFIPSLPEKKASQAFRDDDDDNRVRRRRRSDERNEDRPRRRTRDDDDQRNEDRPRRRSRDDDDERDEDRPRRRSRDDDDDDRPRRKRKKEANASEDKTKQIVGGVIGVLIVIALIVLKIYLRSERRNSSNPPPAYAQIDPPPVHANLPQVPPPQPRFNPNVGIPGQNQLAPANREFVEVQQFGPGEEFVAADNKAKDPPEKDHPELKAILDRWDCKLPDGTILCYQFFAGNGRFAHMKQDQNGSTSWAGEFSFVKSEAKGKKITIKRNAPFKVKPPLFADEHEDGEVEIEIVDAKTIKIKSQKLQDGKLVWRTFKKFEL